MCPVMMHIPVRLLRLFVSILRVFVWWLPSIRSVCACLLVFHVLRVRLLTLSLIMFLMWLSGTRLHTKLLLTVPALTSSSAFSLPQCPVWAFIHLRCTVFSSASLVRALWQSLMDLLLCILLLCILLRMGLLFGVPYPTETLINFSMHKRRFWESCLVTEKFLDKFRACIRARPYPAQNLPTEFYVKEHSKPLFNKNKILNLKNLYLYHCANETFKILNLEVLL